ncbi:hypothetical protein ACFWFF_01400 [Streptomyces sp. NPDC060223]|uniref:hypothetical protein n=1 Tax=unclassified Streptomyces TaxID=2593676 RepID=UPI0036367373
MIEITVRLKPGRARHFAGLLRTAAAIEADRGQAKAFRGAARHLEHATRPLRYTPPVKRPRHREIDEEAVQRVVRGLRPYPVLSPAEARLACRRLTAARVAASEIADRVRTTQRTVNRWRAEDQAVTR